MRPAFLRLLLALALIVAACTPRAAATTGASASSASPVGTLRAGTSGDYPPLSRWTGDEPRPLGFAPSLVEAFAASQRLDVAWTRFRWPGLVADLRAGKFDLAADGITVTVERSVTGRFTVPIARGGAVLLLRRPPWAPAGDGAGGALAAVRAIDLPALRVVVNRGGYLERVTRGLLHHAHIEAIPDNAAVRDAFARHEADAAMTNTYEAPRWAEGLGDLESLGPLTHDVTALWVRADRGDLAERLDAWLLEEEETGRLGRLRTRDLGPGGGAATARPVSALLAATAERLALMPFVAAAKARSGQAVEDTAQEARVIAAARESVARAAAAHGVRSPPRDAVDAFFRAEIEGAKAIQERAPRDVPGAPLSLDADLRPAISRITSRMAFLVVRVPHGTAQAKVIAEARSVLAETGLGAARIDELAETITALGNSQP